MNEAPTPLAVFARFRDALLAKDEAAARKTCAAASWDGEGDIPRKLYAQAVQRGFDPLPVGEIVRADRALVLIQLQVPQRPTPQPMAAMLVVEDGEWKVAGVSTDKNMPELFLTGVLPPIFHWTKLPESPEAAAVGDALIDVFSVGATPTVPGAADLPELLGARQLSRIGAVKAPHVDRHLVGIQFTASDDVTDERWIVLQRLHEGANLTVRSVSRLPQLAALVEGLTPSGEELSMSKDEPLSPEAAKKAMEMAVAEAMQKLAESGAKPDDFSAKVPEMVFGLFNAALENSKTGVNKTVTRSAPVVESVPETPVDEGYLDRSESSEDNDDAQTDSVVDFAAERARRVTPPTEFERKLQSTVTDTFNDYIVEHVSPENGAVPGGEVNVDAEFLKAHGPALFSQMLQAVAKSIIPEEISIELPRSDAATNTDNAAANTDEDGKPKVAPKPPQTKVKIDLAGMINGLLSGVKINSTNQEPPKSE